MKDIKVLGVDLAKDVFGVRQATEYVLDLNRRPANLHVTRDKFLFKAKNEIIEAAA